MRVVFNAAAAERLHRFGLDLNFLNPVEFMADFAVEPPVVVQARIMTDLPFRMGAFSACYGGRLRYVTIGRYCSIAPDLQTGWDEHPTTWATSSMLGYVPGLHDWAEIMGHDEWQPVHRFNTMKGITTIGNDVWIGYGVFIRAGVTIGDGAVVGARSVVLQDVPPYAIVVGTPARVLRYRFDEETISALLRLQWWRYNLFNLPPEIVNDVPRFIDHLSEAIAAEAIEPFDPGWYGAAEIAALLNGAA